MKFDQDKYSRMLKRDATAIVNYAEKIIVDLAPKLFDNGGHSRWVNKEELIVNVYRQKVRDLFEDSLVAWKKLCECRFDETNSIRSWNWIALKASHHDNGWASCWVSGSYCRLRNCPGKDGPWQTSNTCRGEMFQIVNHSSENAYIRSGDIVGLRYSYQGGKGYWISHWSSWVQTLTCPGKTFHGIQSPNSGCGGEKWTITAYGRHHGEKIMHKDVVSLRCHTCSDRGPQYLYWKKWQFRSMEYLEVKFKLYQLGKRFTPSWTIYFEHGTY